MIQQKERLVAIQTDNGFTVYSVNYPHILIQCKTIEESKDKIKALFKAASEYIQKNIVSKEDPFDVELRQYPESNKITVY